KSHHAREKWAPCPCCRPSHPKFYKTVMIAWFPAEAVIRMLGPRCFASINGQGHAEAMRRYNAEKQRAKNIAYLLSRLGLASEAANALQTALPTLTTIDEVRDLLITRLRSGGIKLWDQVRDGVLRVAVQEEEGSGRKGRRKRYAAIDGYRMVDPKHDNFQRE